MERAQHPAEVLAKQLHNDDYAKNITETAVYRIWQNGEITSNELRHSHFRMRQHASPLPNPPKDIVFPQKLGPNTYAYVANLDEALKVRMALSYP